MKVFIYLLIFLIISVASNGSEESCKLPPEQFIQEIKENTQKCAKIGLFVGVALGAGLGFKLRGFRLVRGYYELVVEDDNHLRIRIHSDTINASTCVILVGVTGGLLGAFIGLVEVGVKELHTLIIFLLYE